MMTLKEIEAAALRLSDADREELVEHLKASLPKRRPPIEDDPIWGLGSSPVDCGVGDGSINHDDYFHDAPGQ
jgi:hypothetical protein